MNPTKRPGWIDDQQNNQYNSHSRKSGQFVCWHTCHVHIFHHGWHTIYGHIVHHGGHTIYDTSSITVGIRYMTYRPSRLAYAVWYIVHHGWHMIHDTSSNTVGIRYMTYHPSRLAYDTWHIVHHGWHTLYGISSIMVGIWYMTFHPSRLAYDTYRNDITDSYITNLLRSAITLSCSRLVKGH